MGDRRAPTSATCTSRTPRIQRAFRTAEGDILTTAVTRQIPTAILTVTTPIAARTPMLVVEEPTTPASTGLRLNSCVQNHGFLAEPASQEEHDLIKQHLVIIDGADAYTSYWLGGSDFYEEGLSNGPMGTRSR